MLYFPDMNNKVLIFTFFYTCNIKNCTVFSLPKQCSLLFYLKPSSSIILLTEATSFFEIFLLGVGVNVKSRRPGTPATRQRKKASTFADAKERRRKGG
jgi:hypothetical protein